MTALTAIVSVLLTLSFAVFAVMMARRLWRYAVTPAPLRIPTTPAPLTRFGAVVRLGREVFLFESLFRADKILWLFSMLFHWGLLLVLLRHVRYFLAVPPAPIDRVGHFRGHQGRACRLLFGCCFAVYACIHQHRGLRGWHSLS